MCNAAWHKLIQARGHHRHEHQEESRSISENCTWGKRKAFADGKVSLPFKTFLGYDRGADGNPVINPKQAEIVRLIYAMFLKGKSASAIARYLTAQKIPTPAGKTNWAVSTVQSILANEKYKGDALLQKSYTTDFLTKKKKVNEGELPQYYITKNHEAIIDPATFDLVQTQLALRKSDARKGQMPHAFSQRIKCGECGGWYGSKTWHSTDKHRRKVWQCNHKYIRGDRGAKCSAPHVTDEAIKNGFLVAVNKLIGDKSRIIDEFDEIKEVLFSTAELEKQSLDLAAEIAGIDSLINDLITANASRPLNQTDYEGKYNDLITRLETARSKQASTTSEIQLNKARFASTEIFLDNLNGLEVLEIFDEEVWIALIDFVEVIDKDELIFNFKDGTKVDA
ncbi:MAG: recombinase family protein [Lactobacillales bacterium]|nr:recombinase family protein [Lactobacillales bacterium]